MEKNTRTKNILLVVLLIAVLTLSIAYAALSQTLNINSQAVVKGKNSVWIVKFTAATCTAHGYAVVDTQFSPTTTTDLSGLTGTLKAPGDTIVCELTVSNQGIVDATLSSFTLQQGNLSVVGTTGAATKTADETLVGNNFTYSLVYASDDTYHGQQPGSVTGAAQGVDPDFLEHGTSRNLTLTIGYSNASGVDLPTADVTVSNIHTQFLYVQA
ncbi:MAG: hypothetical protein IK137_00555 [Bacilli bacterium]|nr:hypothetical protein [Bacilli bacterium]